MPQQITLDQKRLETLRRQLQGNSQSRPSLPDKKVSLNLSQTAPSKTPASTSDDTTYLKKDLGKIFTLATLAFLVQIGLYLAMQHGLKIYGLTI